jgi:predicted nucleic acid-binding protein
MASNVVIDTSAILAVLLEEPEKDAVVEATMGSVVCAPASVRWEVGNAATAGVKKRRLTLERARQLITDFEQVTVRELAIDLRRAVDLGLELGIYAYDAYILEAARSSGFPLLALDVPIQRNAKKLGLSLVELDL